MPLIKTRVDRSSVDFDRNREANVALAEDLRALNERVVRGGPQHAREKHLARGKLLPRDRIRLLLDSDAEFLEVGRLAAHAVLQRRGAGGRDHRGHRPHPGQRLHGRSQ